MKLLCASLFLFLLSLKMFAFDGPDSPANDTIDLQEYFAYEDSVQSTFDFKTGTIALGDNLATVAVPKGFVFLNSQDAQRLLTDYWKNPPDSTVLGMLVPEDTRVLSADLWAVVYSYDEDGHVKDDDAAGIEYDDLLKSMQEAIEESNDERVIEGYDPAILVGWAQPPFYDIEQHKLHWAKEIKFGDDSLNTLNYNIRVLGREGVLVMNVIASMDQLPVVKENITGLLASSDFNSGNRYTDYNSSTDKLAEYGVGGLIAGAVLTKTGLLAKLALVLAKGWKLILLAVIVIGAGIRKFFFRKKEEANS